MHRCLQLTEIQAQIFGWLQPSDCTQLALTCSSFYDSACDVVWAEVNTMVHFARCMPSEAFVERERMINDSDTDSYSSCAGFADANYNYVTELELTRSLEVPDWQSFCKHTHRLKVFKDRRVYNHTSIDFYHSQKYQLAEESLRTITSWAQKSGDDPRSPSLFPKLIKLIVQCNEDRGVLQVPAHFADLYRHAEALQELVLDSGGAIYASFPLHRDLADVLPSLYSAWPHLRSVKLTTYDDSYARQNEGYLLGISTWVETLPRLESFETSLSLHPSLIYTLAKLPLLHTLELEGHAAECTPDPDFTQLSPSCFPMLRSLIFTSYEPSSSTPLLQALQHCPYLANIKIHYLYTRDLPDSLDQLTRLYEAISRITTIETLWISLREILSHNTDSTNSEHSRSELSSQLIRMLFSLPRMQDLELSGFYNISLNDADLEDIACAWPGLTSLRLNTDDFVFGSAFMGDRSPAATLVGVQALYNGCPGLECLDIAVNEKLPVEDFVLTLPVPRPRDVPMERLHLHFVPHRVGEGGAFEYGSARYVPVVVRLMFPRLHELGVFTFDDEFAGWADKVQSNWLECAEMDVRQVLERLMGLVDLSPKYRFPHRLTFRECRFAGPS